MRFFFFRIVYYVVANFFFGSVRAAEKRTGGFNPLDRVFRFVVIKKSNIDFNFLFRFRSILNKTNYNINVARTRRAVLTDYYNILVQLYTT